MMSKVHLQQSRELVSSRRVLFVQFSDPAAYPPLEHSSHILADRGWDVVMLGITAAGLEELGMRAHERITVKKLASVSRGWQQKLQYAIFGVRVLYWIWRWRPKWVYASDALSCPIAWLASKTSAACILYHEHDSPDVSEAHSLFMRLIMHYRRRLARHADACILPQRERMLNFVSEFRRDKPTFCVWNCPRVAEIPAVNKSHERGLTLYYHGSVTSNRVPIQLVLAAARFRGSVRIQIAGYETISSQGYLTKLISIARERGVAEMIEVLGVIPRRDVFRAASNADVGLSLMPKQSGDINMRHMVGASNKAFDYMASALPLLVTNAPEWVSTFVDNGFARACEPDDVDSIELQLRWFIEHPTERSQMGREAQIRIRRYWNYETTFAPALEMIECSSGSS